MPADHEQPPLPALRVPKEGDLIAGKYRVEAVIGLGAMGMVIAAQHEHLGERVALKTLLPHIARDPELRKRFQREAQAAFKLQNEHVCRVFDAGTLDDGSPFLVMEFLKGDNLAQVLADAGRLPIPEAVDYVIQACEGVAAAHDIGIIHRDLKPANLFVTKRPDGTKCLKVIDFGISKLKVESAGSVTGVGDFLGSPIYSAPEQLRAAREVTPASDVWSLGVVLYQLLFGQYPFDGDFSNLATVLAAVLAGPVKPTIRDPHFPRDLEAVIMSALQMDSRRRCPSARAFARALDPFRQRFVSAPTQIAASPVAVLAAPPVPHEADTRREASLPTHRNAERDTRREESLPTQRNTPMEMRVEGPPETRSVPPPFRQSSPSDPVAMVPPAYGSSPALGVIDTRLSASREHEVVVPRHSLAPWLAAIGITLALAVGIVVIARPGFKSNVTSTTAPSPPATTVLPTGVSAPSSVPAPPPAESVTAAPTPAKDVDDADASASSAPSSSDHVGTKLPPKGPAHGPSRNPAPTPTPAKSESGPSLMKDRHGL